MRKRGFTLYSDRVVPDGEVQQKIPVGQLSNTWSNNTRRDRREPLVATDVNVSSIFTGSSMKLDAPRVNGKKDGCITSMQSLLNSSRTIPSCEKTKKKGSRRGATIARLQSPLQRQLINGLSSLNGQVRLSSNDEFDQLIEFDELVLLSPNELLVVVHGSKSLVLHSKNQIQPLKVDRFASMKLALNSQCYYLLYNDVYWYMRWKFF